jgi:hypothetical protein
MRKQTIYLSNGTFHGSIDATPHVPGQLGMIVYDKLTDAQYQYVKCSATAAHLATPTVAATIMAMWKDSKAFEVCTLLTQSEGLVNSPAGVFLGVPTAGQYCWIQKSGKAFVIADSTAVGSVVCVKTGVTTGSCTTTTAGTAPINKPVGTVVNVTVAKTWAGASRTTAVTLPEVQLQLAGE